MSLSDKNGWVNSYQIYDENDDNVHSSHKQEIFEIEDLKQSLQNFETKLRKLGVEVNKDGLKLVGVELAIWELRTEFGEKLTESKRGWGRSYGY